MQNSWTRTKLGDHIQTLKGYAFKSQWYSDKGVPLVKVTDFTGDAIDTTRLMRVPNEIAVNYSKYELKTDDVVIQTVGSWPTNPQSVVGKVIRVPRSANRTLLNQNAVKIIPDKSIDKKFLFYALRSPSFKNYIVGCAQGAASQASITLDAIRNYDLSFPKLEHQCRIAAILSAYDGLIENNTRRTQILEEMARRNYEEWFVRCRFPGHEKVRLVESELGLIPDGWKVQSLYDISELTYGFPFKSKLFNSNGGSIGIVRIRDIRTDKASAYTDEPFDQRHLLSDGDLLIGMDGEFHMGRWAGGKAALNQRVVMLRPKGNLSKYFLFLLIEKPIKHLEATIVGTTVAHLSAKDLKSIKLITPSDDILKVIRPLFDSLFKQEIALKKKNEVLRRTRDLLLPKLISGEVDVSNFPNFCD